MGAVTRFGDGMDDWMDAGIDSMKDGGKAVCVPVQYNFRFHQLSLLEGHCSSR